MPAITTPTPPETFNSHDPLLRLDPTSAFHHSSQPHNLLYPCQPFYTTSTFTAQPNLAMDLQYILSPSVLLEEKQQQPPKPTSPPLVFEDEHKLVCPTQTQENAPSSSRIAPSPPHVHPNPDDAIISFDGKTGSFPKPTKPSTPNVVDPYAENFLRDMLGPERWETFSTRLFERRLGGKGKGKAKQGEEDDSRAGASAVEFLVKVEVVKSILRECVPHPYNPRKSLSHPYPPAPSGHVTLTRSTVLLLCGWSNTQFSYWARRSEAVSVLAQYDPRLRAVRAALERRLRADPLPPPDDEDDGTSVTGKGLDLIIEEVKRRTGKSQFLRGKHSSLDPFGTLPQDPTAPPPLPQYAMPTFQAESYDHSPGDGADTDSPPSRRSQASPTSPSTRSKRRSHQAVPLVDSTSRSPATPSQQLASPTSVSSQKKASRSPRASRTASRAGDDDAHHFPVSDSRSEVENTSSGSSVKRKADDAGDEDVPVKRARTSEGGS